MAKSTVNRRVNIYVNGKEVKNDVKSITSEFHKTRKELNLLNRNTKEYQDKLKTLKQLQGELDKHRNAVRGISKQWQDFKTIFLGTLGSNLAAGFFQRIISFFPNLINGLGKVSDQLADIRKVTGATEEEVTKLDRALGKIQTRTAKADLRLIAVEGGRLNIPVDELAAFVEVADKAGVALGDDFAGGAAEATATIGKMVSEFKETRNAQIDVAMERAGSAINELGANTKASAGPIANFTKRIGALPDALKPSIQETLALGAAFDETGVDAEQASRGYGIFIGAAAKDIEGFAEVMGLGVEQVRELINTDPAEFFLQFSESLNGLPADETARILDKLGIAADGVKKIVGAASSQTERFRQIMLLSNKAYAQNTSLAAENALKQETLQAKLDKLRKKIAALFTGETLQKWARNVVEGLISVTNWLERNASALKIVAKLVFTGSSAWVAYKVAVKLAASESGKFLVIQRLLNAKMRITRGVTIAAAAAKAFFTGNTTRATAAMRLFNIVTKANPLGLLISLVTAAATAFFLFRKEVDETAKITEHLASISKRHQENLIAEKTAVDGLFQALLSSNAGSEERKNLIDEINDKYNLTLKNLEDESDFLNQVATAQDKVIANLEIMAKRDALSETMAEQQKAIYETERSIERLLGSIKKGTSMKELSFWEKFLAGTNVVFPAGVFDTASEAVLKKVEELRERLKKLKADSKETSKALTQALIDSVKNKPKGGSGGGGGGGEDEAEDEFNKLVDTFDKDMAEIAKVYTDSFATIFKKNYDAISKNYDALRDRQKEYLDEGLIDQEEYNARLLEIDFQVAVERAAFVKQTQEKLNQDLFKLRENLAMINADRTMDEAQKARRAVVEQFQQMRQDLQELLKQQLDFVDAQGGALGLSAETIKEKKDEILEEYAALLEEINLEEEEALGELEDDLILQRWRDRIAAVEDYADKTFTILRDLNQTAKNLESKRFAEYKATENRKLHILQARYEAGKVSEQEYYAQKLAIENEYDAKRKALAIKQWKRERALSIAEATIQGFLAISKAIASAPPPANVPAIVAASLLTAANMAKLLTAPAPEFRKGTFQVLNGPSHEGGGIGLWNNATGKKIGDAEGGEAFMVLSKAATKNNMPLIEALAASSQGSGANVMRSMANKMPQLNVSLADNALRFKQGMLSLPESNIKSKVDKGSSADMMPFIKVVQDLNGNVITLGQEIAEMKKRPLNVSLQRINEAQDLDRQAKQLARYRS